VADGKDLNACVSARTIWSIAMPDSDPSEDAEDILETQPKLGHPARLEPECDGQGRKGHGDNRTGPDVRDSTHDVLPGSMRASL